MHRATTIVRSGAWPQADACDRVTLGYDDRHRRRLRLVADGGLEFLLDLPEAAVLRGGDGLRLEDGTIIAVAAAEESLIEVRAGHGVTLARLAWHLGNRHLPCEIQPDRLLIRDDHVILDMLRGLGAETRSVHAPFDPEGGAYGQHNHDPGHHHRHDHHHDEHDGHHHH